MQRQDARSEMGRKELKLLQQGSARDRIFEAKTCRKWRVNVEGDREFVEEEEGRVKRKGKAKEGRDSFLQK